MNAIVQQGLSKMSEHEFQARETQPIERYEWPLAAGMLLLCGLDFHPRTPAEPRRARPPQAVAAALAVLLLFPLCGWAKNEGVESLRREGLQGRLRCFPASARPEPGLGWAAIRRGRRRLQIGRLRQGAGGVRQSHREPEPGLRSQAEYNLGNTLVQRGALAGGQRGKNQGMDRRPPALRPGAAGRAQECRTPNTTRSSCAR